MPENAKPIVTIILVNWNGREDTLACLRSLRKVIHDRIEIILVDNASTDGSVAAVQAEFPEVEIIRNTRNERFARANNQAMRIALQRGAKYLLLLNNDTEVDAEFVQHLVSRAERDGAIGMVGPKIYHYDQPNLIWFAGGGVSMWRGKIWHYGLRQEDRGQYDVPRDVDYITGCCLLVTRRCLEKIGMLDESYYMYVEDVDWCYRAKQAGYRLVYEPRARIWHKISSSSGGPKLAGGLSAFKIRHKVAAMLKFFRRRAKWYHWLTIPIFWLIEFIRAAATMLAGRNLRGIWTMLRALFAK